MDEVAQAHARLVQDATIQFSFPAADPAPAPLPASGPLLPDMGGFLFWLVIVVVGAALLAVVVGNARGWRLPRATPAPPDVAPAAPVVLPRAVLDEADALAEAGRYGEAVHALLLRGVEAIGRRFPQALAPSDTSRDIAGLSVLPAEMRAAFAGLAERTERAVFARRVLTAGDWQECRALYAGLSAPRPRP